MIYLDNNATTPVDPSALDAMLPFLREGFFNPSGAYAGAKAAARAIEEARGHVAKLWSCDTAEVVFTAGGTESDTTAILSAVACFTEKRHLVTCATEHPAVVAPLEHLRDHAGYELTVLGVAPDGTVDLDELRAAVRPGATALVSLMWANNETGVIQPVAEAAAIAAGAGALFHCDAVQAAGKIPLDLPAAGVHYAALSGHKLHAPKGVGALFVSRDARFQPLLRGGGQEGGRRSGTENVAGIVALGAAAAAASSHLEAAAATPAGDPVGELRDHLESRLLAAVPGAHLNTGDAPRTPNTTSIRFDGIEADGLLLLLDRAGLACSAGAACHTGAVKGSTVLLAMGLSPAAARGTLRLSLSRFTTRDEVDQAVDTIRGATGKLRSLRPAGQPVSTA